MKRIIKIEPLWMTQVTKYLGGPGIDSIFLNEDEVKAVCLFPAMMEYFQIFPIMEQQTLAISGNNPMEVPFPDEYTFGLVDARHTDKGAVGGSRNDPFLGGVKVFQANNLGVRYGLRHKRRGVIQPSGAWYRDALNKRQVYDAMQGLETYKVQIDQSKRKVYVFASGSSTAVLTWAKYSLDFDADIKFEQKTNVVKLAGAYLLDHAADTSSILNDSTQEKEFNADAMRSRAEAIKEEIKETWANHPRVVIVRGS